ncbi:MAG: hypothetical protein A2Y40_09690 [Candidatus Margulisbacteria bacterium GWF2_35_9]|nr:MAG: hypothetical protein A2Y40_09690 [Candidatus Margulisbacteria bacterium GWF2_35_9]
MQQFKDIVNNFKNKRIKDNFLINDIYKKVVNEQILSKTVSINYKNKELFLEISDNAWANEILNLKTTLLKKMKEHFSDIKNIKIRVNLNSKKEEKPNNQENTIGCGLCGSKLLTKGSLYCVVCENIKENEKRYQVFKIIKETPWISYNDLEIKDQKSFTEQDFYREKKFQIRKIYDTINQAYINLKCNNSNADLNYFKEKIEELVILKLNLQPERLKETIIEQNISLKWYKLYKTNDR